MWGAGMMDKRRDASLRVLMVMLCTHCMLGGAEKRYARVFKMLTEQSWIEQKLLINRRMLDLLQSAGVLTAREMQHLIVVDPPLRHLVRQTASHLPGRVFFWASRLQELLWYAWQYLRTVLRYKPDVVHPLLTAFYLSLPVMILKPQQRFMTSAYSNRFRPREDFHGTWAVGLATRLKLWILRHSRVIDALKESIRDELIDYGVDESKICVAPCSFTDSSVAEPSTRREKWVVFLARLIETKNPFLFIQAIPQILKVHPDAHFYVLGEGPLEEQLNSQVQAFGLLDHVTTGLEAHPAEILNRSSIFVSLQDQDNYPSQSLLEAMVCGNAIVATDVGETWRLVDESDGIRIAATPEALAAAVVALLDDPHLTELGQNARQRVLTEYTADRFLAYIMEVYRRAACQPSDTFSIPEHDPDYDCP